MEGLFKSHPHKPLPSPPGLGSAHQKKAGSLVQKLRFEYNHIWAGHHAGAFWVHAQLAGLGSRPWWLPRQVQRSTANRSREQGWERKEDSALVNRTKVLGIYKVAGMDVGTPELSTLQLALEEPSSRAGLSAHCSKTSGQSYALLLIMNQQTLVDNLWH